MQLPSLSFAAEAAGHFRRGASHVELAGPWGSAKSLAAVQVATALDAPLLVVTQGRLEAEGVHDDLTTFCEADSCHLLPGWEVLPGDAMDPSDDIVAERMETLQKLSDALAGSTRVRVVMPLRSLMQYVISPGVLGERRMTLRTGEEYDLEDLLLRLAKLGYVREMMVEQRGQMSARGGLLDIFPISCELPVRIEFFGDEIESIRRFEPETQRSVGLLDSVDVLPRSEKELLLRETAALRPVLEYLPKDTLIVLDEPTALHEQAASLERQFGDSPYFMRPQALEPMLSAFRRLSIAQIAYAGVPGVPRIKAPMHSISGWEPPAEDFWSQLSQWDAAGYTVVLLSHNPGELQRLQELLAEHEFRLGQDAFDLRAGLGRLRAGFSSSEEKLAILSDREIFGRSYVRRARRRFEAGETITAFSDLRSGDYVVHALHGVGRYLGIKRFADKAGDFLAVQYAGGDKVYVPVTSVDMVQKFTGGEGALPKVDRIGGATWARRKAKVKKAVHDMAEALISLYAARENRDGHSFSPDTPWQREFEDAFEYDETPDQMRSILDTKRDMESARPMDRLLCGDVGFGKTEVAIRAAFKAVQDNKQVAILAPTTVLAEQHYITFTQRMADYPIRIGLLCRFRTPKEQAETLERLKSGEVDIVIGTHRIVSKDVKFHDLGLIIIDEEHKFGVAQKERLKQMRTTVDALNMSATPIPRTLNLAMMGVRDMSVINTAPNDRLPVHTCIESFNEDLIREAMARELARQGQIYFVHNRVQTIDSMAGLVQRLAPEARLEIGHGQMPERQLERVITGFMRHNFDILVCTTIIGSGIDIPNANTIIINNADHFGLSELYQLRGRVGRYKHRAFAYLLVPGDRVLSEDAQKRLQALEDFSSLGSGFRIAMSDMEIRGCGDILGSQQHGHIAAVGLDTYADLLKEAVSELRGEPVVRRVLPQFEANVDAHVPEAYVPSETQRITLYKRIASVKSIEEVEEMGDELRDRFGELPHPVKRLLDVMRIRARGADLGVRHITGARSAIAITFESERFLTRAVRNSLSTHFGKRLTFTFDGAPALTYSGEAETTDVLRVVENILTALEDMDRGE